MKKYKLTDETETITRAGAEITLYRVQALRAFGDIKAGQLGGYVESEANLSHDGDCWIFGNAKVYGSAKVYDNAEVYGSAKVYDNAKVYGSAKVYDNTWICGSALVYGSAKVYGNTWIFGSAEVYE